ncbi:hypothetical protein G5V58_09570 [Nocardioides anomalus]|uniref:Uncharacterized protein n=1 Tax=Nocardioides anomalus TaxID=2712223 RepID=A0A6G6WCP6_9ACTN|nr:hypothetical protein [Nocardioides anomalus]QIG42976.1 hypothetical protein G5V58_09570 [Nocardioides anomalus]
MLVETAAARVLGVPADAATVRFVEADEAEGTWAGRRLLLLDDRPAYELSFWCGTCGLLFRRLEGADHAPSIDHDDLRSRLAAGLDGVDSTVVDAYGAVLARGEHRPLLLELRPRLVQPGTPDDYFTVEQVRVWGVDPFWGLPQYPATPYYRTTTRRLQDDTTLHEFVVGMVPPRYNDPAQVDAYADAMEAGAVPCAVAVSVLDVTAPATTPGEEWGWHWGLTHFLLDGHHKLQAAARTGRPVRLLSLLALDHGLATREQVDRALEARAATR